MTHPYYLRVAYVGTAFHGWQIQSILRSVQGDLWQALCAVDPEAPMPQGTGRTDAGVHARAQGVLVRCSRAWEPYRLMAALNAHLPWEVRVMEAQPVPEDFWPRQHAVAKRYIYRLAQGPAEDPFQHDRRWHVYGARPLDLEAMDRAARCLVGAHDFSSFRCAECAARTPHRIIHAIELREGPEGPDLRFEGNRFLMHQVRIMSGTLVEVGKGRLPWQSMAQVLEARDRRMAGPTAPPQGLLLDQVWYQARWGVGEPCPWGEPSWEEGGDCEAPETEP